MNQFGRGNEVWTLDGALHIQFLNPIIIRMPELPCPSRQVNAW